MRSTVASIVVGLTVVLVGSVVTPPGALAQVSTAPQAPVTFTNDIRPIMERSCWSCHGADQIADLDLRTPAGALEGGMSGPAIVPGRADESPLYRRIAGLKEPPMPMQGALLSDAEVAAVRAWINEGAHWDVTAATTADRAETVPPSPDANLPPGARELLGVPAAFPGASPDVPRIRASDR